ncbi:MAG: phage integrase SAM-like domain-containing protein [Paludibacter sp.]|nr:phage integrase SAM-like domain-containing protein [Paludibacter sp.]
MAKISFYLTNPKTKNETNLYCLINYGLYSNESGAKKYLPLKYYTNVVIIPDLWNKDLNRAKESNKWANPETFDISIQAVKESARKNYNAINSEIETFERTAKELIRTLSENGNVPSHDKLRSELDKIYKPTKVTTAQGETPKEFFPFIDFFINTATRKENTIKSYKTLKNNLLEYQKDNKTTLTFDRIDIDFYNSFIDYLTKPKTIKTKTGKTKTVAGLSINTIGTRIKILKTFLSAANDRGINVPTDYTKKSFKKPNEESFSIYLNESELRQMYNKSDLPLYLERVRDLFLIGCYTGLRFSDLTQLKKENITADNTINITTQKTNQKVVVPIHPVVREIFKKYDYKLPKIPTNQKFNEFLKEVAKLAKIKEPITMESTKGGFKVSETTEKFNLVTSHTARRSFATNAFLMDMPSISIMKITGHKTESAFMRYIKMSAKDNAIKMQSHKFFNPMLIAK